MKKLLELEAKLKKAKEELEKQSLLANMNPMGAGVAGGAGAGIGPASIGVNQAAMGKDEDNEEDDDKKKIAEALDDHNEKKHGEAKDVDSAKKLVKFYKNGQWSMD